MLMILGTYGMMGNKDKMIGGVWNSPFAPLAGVLWILTWIAIVFVLVALGRLFWKKGDKLK